MSKKRVAVIGLGHQSEEDHIPALLESKHVDLVAVCDINNKKLEEVSKKLSIKGYKDYNKLLLNEELDFIIVATPHHTHKKILEKAIELKIHILKEKPFVLDLKEANKTIKSLEKNKVHLMITMQRRFNPIYYVYFQLVEQIGNIYSIDINYNLFVKNPHVGWRGSNSKAGGGCIIDMGYHMIDMIIWYFGLPDNIYTEMTARAIAESDYNAEDSAKILFSYNKGVKKEICGLLNLSRFKPPKTETIEIYGTKGIIKITRGDIKRLDIEGNEIESLQRTVAWKTAAINQIDYFCKVIDGEKENISSAKNHLLHMAFVDACYKSSRLNKNINPYKLLKK